MGTYSSLALEVCNRYEFPGMSVDERFEPAILSLVADLEDVREDGTAVLLSEVLEGGSREVLGVEFAVQLLLRSRNGVFNLD